MDIPGITAQGQGLRSLFKPRMLLKSVTVAETAGLCPMQEVKPE